MSFDNNYEAEYFDIDLNFNLLEDHQEEENQIREFQSRVEEYEHELENLRKRKWGGSVLGRLGTVERNYEEAHNRLMNDYFISDSKYKKKQFRRRFRMHKQLFLQIMDRIVDHDSYFQQKTNAANKCGISPHIKITAALRQLAYSVSADSLDEYFQISATTANDSLKRFCSAVIDVFGDEYLRAPTESDIEQLLDEGEKRGFPGMLGSLDCMH